MFFTRLWKFNGQFLSLSTSLTRPKTLALLFPWTTWPNPEPEARFSTTAFKARFKIPTSSSPPLPLSHLITTTILVRPATVIISARTALARTDLIARVKSICRPGLSSQQTLTFIIFSSWPQQLSVASSTSPGYGQFSSGSNPLLQLLLYCRADPAAFIFRSLTWCTTWASNEALSVCVYTRETN